MLKTGFMKKVLVAGMLAMLATTFAWVAPVSARDHGHLEINFGGRKQQKKDCKRTLRRTNEVLQRAQQMAQEMREDREDRHGGHHGRRHHGRREGLRHRGLGRAFAFQQRAQEYYHNGDYEVAIHLSLRSRAIAYRVIRRMEGWDNDDNWRDDGDDFRHTDMDRSYMDDSERRYWENRPDDDKLEVEISDHDVDDDVAVNFNIDLDF